MSYVENFIETIIEKSTANNWDNAKTEWEHIHSFEEPNSTCVCGKTDITDVCVIKNRITGERLEVGNRCVKKIGVEVDDEFRWIKGKRKSIPKRILKRAVELQIITEWEYTFYLNVMRYKRLSESQKYVLTKIKTKLEQMKKRIVDEQVFGPLETFQDEHRKILMTTLKDLMVKLNDNSIRVSETEQTLKGILVSVNSLKKYYRSNESN